MFFTTIPSLDAKIGIFVLFRSPGPKIRTWLPVRRDELIAPRQTERGREREKRKRTDQ